VHIQAAQSQQKSYANKRRRPLEFKVGDRVFLKVSLTKGMQRFGLQGKLSPRYIRLYKIINKLNPVAYQLDMCVDVNTYITCSYLIAQKVRYIS